METIVNGDDVEILTTNMCSSLLATPIKVYKKRWYILCMYSLMTFMQSELINSWTVIDESAEVVFSWSKQQISLFQIWIYIPFVVAFFPFLWLMDKHGMRISVILSAGMSFTGSLLRCFSHTEPSVTWLVTLGHIFIGLSGPVTFTAGPVLSALWFPSNQRATATAIATISGFAGAAGCFALGPSIIEQPQFNFSSSGSMTHLRNYTNIDRMRNEIMYVRYGECVTLLIIFVTICVYFPNKPKLPPSISASMEKLHLGSALKLIFSFKNYNFWLICLAYTVTTSIYGLWSALFNINLKVIGITEKQAGWLGFWAVTVGCISAVIIGRIADILKGKMKLILCLLITGSVLSTFCFLLIGMGFLVYNEVLLYTVVIIQGLCINGAIPLYYELAMECSYPISETMTSGVMSLVYNVFPLAFLIVFLIPNAGTWWMNWVMYGTVLVSFPMILLFKEMYKRLQVDSQ